MKGLEMRKAAIRNVLAMPLVTACACCAREPEQVVNNGFFGKMKVLTHSEAIAKYDKYANEHPNTLVHNFMDLCCNQETPTDKSEMQPGIVGMDTFADMMNAKKPASDGVLKRFISFDAPALCARYTPWTKDELKSELEQVVKHSNGENLLKVIASKYIDNKELRKICFVTPGTDTSVRGAYYN